MNDDNRLSKIKLTIGSDVRDRQRIKVYGELQDAGGNIFAYIFKAPDGEILVEIYPEIAGAPIVVSELMRMLEKASKEVLEKSD